VGGHICGIWVGTGVPSAETCSRAAIIASSDGEQTDVCTTRRRVYSQGFLMTDISFEGAMLGGAINQLISLLLRSSKYRIFTSCNYPPNAKNPSLRAGITLQKRFRMSYFFFLPFLSFFLPFFFAI
jgi:hypothetical protein